MKSLFAPVLAVLLAGQSYAASLTVSKPEDAGLSSERLKRIQTLMQGHTEAKDFAGAVTLVTRRGKVVQHEAYGLMDLDAKKPMRTDTLFRLASMTKPITAVAILMLMEDGKLLLTDPVSKYLPEFKNPKVAVWNMPNDPKGSGYRLAPADRWPSASRAPPHCR